jgi:hypothetical protein
MTTPQYLHPNGGNAARWKPYVRIQVETLPGVRVGIGGHSFIGAAVVDIPHDELASVQAKVRDPGEWARCERLAAERIARLKESKKDASNVSAAGIYFELYGKGAGSLARVEVLEENVPPPLSGDEEKLSQVMAHVQRRIEGSDEEPTPVPRKRGRPPRASED